MSKNDVIEQFLTLPIAWDVFEDLAYNVLVSDDLPSLRKLGGGHDWGLDAETVIYTTDSPVTRIAVQVTSQQAQVAKFKTTVDRLREKHVEFTQLVMVYRAPISSEVRREISAKALELGVVVDPRDLSYLVTQLGKHSQIFNRFFKSVPDQVKSLLATGDALSTTSDQLKHALLATLSCYIGNPRVAFAKNTLFEKTVLAAAVNLGAAATPATISKAVQELAPGEKIEHARLASTLHSLKEAHSITIDGEKITVKEDVLTAIGSSIVTHKSAINDLITTLVDHCNKQYRLNQAQMGYLERNTKLALLALIRSLGPVDFSSATQSPFQIDDSVQQIFGRDLPSSVSHSAIAALSSYVSTAAGRANLAILVRSYAALTLRNMDVMGRRWQAGVLSRSVFALDTDVVLRLIVKELPEHATLLGALQSLQKRGIKIVVPDSVLHETIVSLSQGAHNTYGRFSRTLAGFSEEIAEGVLWNAVVRGYFYSQRKNPKISWSTYHAKYYNEQESVDYAAHILRQRIPSIEILPLEEIPLNSTPELEEAVGELLTREKARPKAAFRTEGEMRLRIYRDLKILMHLSERSSTTGEPKGYFFSGDMKLAKAEGMKLWGGRLRVWMSSASLPELAALIGGYELEDDNFVRILFSPIIAAATREMLPQIEELLRVGVKLGETPLEKLEWDLRHRLVSQIRNYEGKKLARVDDDELGEAALDLATAAKDAGYALAPEVQSATENYKTMEEELGVAKNQVASSKDKMFDVLKAVAGTSKKGKKRVRKALKQAGIELDEYVSALLN